MKYKPYSYSKLNEYRKCPRRFKFHYIDHIPGGGSSPAADEGRAFHRFAETFDTVRMAGGTPNFDYIINDALNHIRPPMSSESVVNVTQMALDYSNKPIKPEFLIGLEYKFGVTERWEVCRYDSPDAYFRGVWDQVFVEGGLAEVNDHKTSRMMRADPFQRECYCAAVTGVFPQVSEVNFSFLYSRLNWVDKVNVSMKSIKDAKSYIDHLIICAETDTDFKATPSEDACKYCPYHHICPAKQGQGVDFSRMPTTFEEAEEMVQAMVGAAETQSMIKKRLKEYVDEYGPFETDGKRYAISDSISWRGIDAVTILLTLQEFGVPDWHACISPKWQEIRDRIESLPDLEAHLDRIGTRSMRQSFSGKSIDKPDKKT